MGYALGGNFNFFARLRVSPNPGRSFVKGKTAKATNLDTLARGQSVGHGVEYGFDSQVRISEAELRMPLGQLVDEFGLGHTPPLNKKLFAFVHFGLEQCTEVGRARSSTSFLHFLHGFSRIGIVFGLD
jgi:hypothetical protein